MSRVEKHRAEIDAELEPGEEVVSWLPADDIVSATSMAPTISGVLAITSSRFVFRGASRRGAAGRELLLAETRGIEAVWHRAAVDLRFAGNPEFPGFLSRRVDLAVPFIAAAEAALAMPTSITGDGPATPAVADLAALGDLFERGLLTAAEFSAAKKRLLE